MVNVDCNQRDPMKATTDDHTVKKGRFRFDSDIKSGPTVLFRKSILL